jgi:predicted DNA-binding transcriptional regulator YafY
LPYKHDYDKILTRLTRILSRLNDGEVLSITELAEEFNVSTRTIQRDLNERLSGFPIYQDGKRWRMQEGYRLEKSTSLEESVVLEIMEKLVEGAGRTFALKASHLLTRLKNPGENPFYARLDMEDIGDKLREIQQLEQAIGQHRVIACRYRMEAEMRSFTLKPLKIASYEGFWYLIALQGENDRLKKYYLKNLSAIEIQPETFALDTALDSRLDNALSIWFEQEVDPYRVHLHLSSEVVKYFQRKPLSPTQRTEEMRQDGSMVVSVAITHDMEIIPIVKYWLPHIRVMEPKRIAKQIGEDLQRYLEAGNLSQVAGDIESR